MNEFQEKSIIIYAKRNDKLCLLKVYDYEKESELAQKVFSEMMNDETLSEYRMMTIQEFSKLL